jgi:hypothetical protein
MFSGMSLCRSPFILLGGNLIQNLQLVASHQVSVHLAKQLQRRFLESTNQKQEWPVAAMLINGWELNAHSL